MTSTSPSDSPTAFSLADASPASATSLPAQGFGTYTLTGRRGAEAIAAAITAGYRLIDTAVNYDNEGAVGAAITTSLRNGVVTRDELHIVSKLPGRYHAAPAARACVEESLFRLGLDVIDSYLIHWPNPRQGRFVEAFAALLEARDAGLIRHVGVCNFLPEHLDALAEATGEYPAINQVELHPHCPQVALRAYHADHGILTQSWSPLARGAVLADATIASIAQRHASSPAQVVLAWHAAVGAQAIPKSADPERQRANLAALDLELSAEEVAAITALGSPDGGRPDRHPATHEEF